MLASCRCGKPTRFITASGVVRARLLLTVCNLSCKLPESALEIVRGLSISGEIRSYSTFVNTAMVAVLDEYEINACMTCAAGGERPLTCAQRGIAYIGTDISEVVVAAHQGFVDRLRSDGCQ